MKNKKIGAEEITLAPKTEIYEKAHKIALETTTEEKFPFVLDYDANEKETLLSMLNEVGAEIEKESATHASISVRMNMTQLKLVKGLECVMRVRTPGYNHRSLIKREKKLISEDFTHINVESDITNSDDNSGNIAVMSLWSPPSSDVTEDYFEGGGPSDYLSSTKRDSAKEIDVGDSVEGCICCPGAEKYFKFKVIDQGIYTIYTTGDLDTVGHLYDSNGNLITYVDDYEPCGEVNFRIIRTLAANSTYYIKVHLRNNDTGEYTLRITDAVLPNSVTITPGTITLKQGVTYELPITPNYTYKGYNGAQRIPGLSVSISPSNANEQKIWWWEQYGSVLDCSYGLDDDGDRYIHVTATNYGTAKLYAEDWNENGKRDECTVCVGVDPAPINGLYNIVNIETGKVANISGSYLVNLSDGKNITLYSNSASNEQVWKIDKISDSEDCYIKSYVDQEYGFNAYRSSSGNYNCNIHKITGNETDAAVYFVLQDDGSYKIKLANYSNYYLTATGSTDGSDIRWHPEDSTKNQLWKLVNFDIEQREAEKAEYHIVPYSDMNLTNKRALQVNMNTPNDNGLVNKTYRLAHDEPLELEAFSYINKQK